MRPSPGPNALRALTVAVAPRSSAKIDTFSLGLTMMECVLRESPARQGVADPVDPRQLERTREALAAPGTRAAPVSYTHLRAHET